MGNSPLPEIKSLVKAVEVLDFFASAPHELTFTEVRQGLGLSKATTHRFLAALTELGLLRRISGQATYVLGLHLVELGAAAASQIDLRAELRPLLRALRQRTEETSNLALLVAGDAFVVDQVESPHEFRVFARVGRSVPPATSSLGKVLLAYAAQETRAAALAEVELSARTPHSITSLDALADELALVRARGYAIDDEENRLGVLCIGAPVRDSTGDVVAALSISGPRARLAGERLEECVEAVRATAIEASRMLGHYSSATGRTRSETAAE